MGSMGRLMNRKLWLLLAFVFLGITLVVFEISDLDFRLQDRLYSFEDKTWIVPKKNQVPRALFYHGPKILLIAFGVWILASLIVPETWRARRFLSRKSPRQLIYLAICLGLFPAFIGALKKASGIHCPSELLRYSGEHQYRNLFSPRPEDSKKLGHCFPAGHASGGFSLFSLWFIARTNRARKVGLTLGLTAGWLMGLYQMLSGAHFLSHTLVTMLLAWIFTLTMAMLFRLEGQDPIVADAQSAHC